MLVLLGGEGWWLVRGIERVLVRGSKWIERDGRKRRSVSFVYIYHITATGVFSFVFLGSCEEGGYITGFFGRLGESLVFLSFFWLFFRSGAGAGARRLFVCLFVRDCHGYVHI